MKKIYYLFFAMIGISCSKNDTINVFDELPEERIGKKLEELQDKLLESPYGWNASLPTSGSGGYGFYMDFHEDQTVDMFADLNVETAGIKGTSTYRIKWVMYPTLLFDTYNYITMLQDPASGVYGGVSGSGLRSDIEFEYLRSTADSIVLRGKKYQNELILTKASQEEKAKFEDGKYSAIIEGYQEFFLNNKNNYVVIAKGGTEYKVGIVYNHSAKTLAYEALELSETISSGSSKFCYTIHGIRILTGLTYGDVTLERAVIKENGNMYLYDSQGREYEVFQNPNPLTPLKFLFNYNGTYKSIYIGASLPTGVVSDFNAVYQSSVTKFAAMNPTRTLVDVMFTLTNSTTATVRTRNNNGTTTFTANATYNYVYEDGIITLSNPSYDGNWSARRTQLIDIENYFLEGPFKIDWVISSDPSVEGLGGLYKVSDESSFFYGTAQ